MVIKMTIKLSKRIDEHRGNYNKFGKYRKILNRRHIVEAYNNWSEKYTQSFQSVQPLSCVWLFATPWTAAHQASLSTTNSWSLLKHMSIESVMPSSHLILYHPLLLLSPIPPSIRVFSNESALHMRWPKSWSFSFSISPSNEHSG